MKKTHAYVVAALLLCVAGSRSVLAAPKPVPPPGPAGSVFVTVPPCRIFDSSSNAAQPGAVHVRVADTACGPIVPEGALAYVFRKVNDDRTPPEKANASSRNEQIVVLPAQANQQFDFTVPPNADLAVEVLGYYVPEGSQFMPGTAAAQAVASSSEETNGSAAVATAARTPRAVTMDDTGSSGTVSLSGPFPGLNQTGMLLQTTSSSYPYIVARVAAPNAPNFSGFGVFDSSYNSRLMVRADGPVQLLTAPGFLDGQTKYYGSNGASYSSVSIPRNVVHDVTLTSPVDSAGGTSTRVVFFNGRTDSETNSPPVTKFQAYTENFTANQHVNFDSQVKYHQGTFSHFRAYSTAENKDTFWVRAATDVNSTTSTRADMYVSGHIGLNNPAVSPWGSMRAIEGADSALTIGNVGDIHVTSNSYFNNAFQWIYKAAGPAANYYAWNGTHTFRVAGSGAAGATIPWVNALTIDNSGAVGVNTTPGGGYKLDVTGAARVTGNLNVSGTVTGVINAVFQDVAEWVPANGELADGTVVVLDPTANNHVIASSQAYDTTVAGVVSPRPGIILGEGGDSKAKVATTGRVRVRVDATSAPIAIGDLLVTSDVAGTAMKSQPIEVSGRRFHQPGTIIGKALEPLASGKGEILVLLSLQ